MTKKTLNTEIIAVGTELLLGQIANTNAQWISEQLAANGINTFFHTVVGDNLDRLSSIFKHAQERSNVIIVTGGLGPTADDLSREAFQKISQLSIVEEPNAMEKIKQFYEKQKLFMTPNNKRQARVFKDSKVLTNKVGMAPGNIVKYQNSFWVFLPGVPREMKQLFTDDVLPFLKSINGEMVIQSTVLRFTGIGESALEDKLSKLIASQQNPTIAPLAAKDGVTIRLTAKAVSTNKANELLERTKTTILKEVGEYFYGVDRDELEEKVFSLLQTKNKRIASAESLTGGLFSDRFVSLNGASTVFLGSIVCYDPDVKLNILQVQKQTIEEKGTVSEACAIEMAKNVAELLNADIGISFTGVAGPLEVEGRNVGTVYIGLFDVNGYEYVEECFFQGDRNDIRYRSVLKGLEILFNYLK
ncbi:competence/damage-inducible protein A [Pseudogracilibacillus sp. SO30301A]|uniref:competence/damage-inducible protein A n=1 Tax=Pseudogracilibacillus sp. SO30301A TaxID=3098291 RepID=UPI00300E4D88